MLTPQQRSALVDAMTGDSPSVRTIDVGYTYIGQFIAHDITEPAHPRNNHHPTAALDLDSLYGTAVPAAIDARGRFEIGRGEGDIPDLLRDASGQARIPDLRNDENVIVAQLHLFWQRFHNFLLDQSLAKNFDEARELTIKTFLLVVVEDYLQLLLAPKVFEQYFRRGQRHWLNLPSSPVPLLFSKAAFRFGHSMVRDFYELAGRVRDTAELFRADRPLTADFHVAWRQFFGWPDQATGVPDALAIDTLVTPTMVRIPFPPGQQTNIVEKNILASETLQHTGMQLVEQFLMQNPELASVFDLAPQTQLSPDLKKLKGVTLAELPLWPYILNEAAVEAGGERLGTFGSLICAEVLANSIEDAGLLSWPLQLADALTSLGALGTRIREVAAVHDRPLPAENSPAQNNAAQNNPAQNNRGRLFCMRHLIELLEPTSDTPRS
ncbi:MAG TPA: peroxidase family protein [Steroidobacter sp.]|uniref:peroxidase family protein n=1 Tax=Steroidobacter sp. TaxID=1978227 RepID=UPI002ED7F45D